jgi:anti-anti-sigma regulatory factor
MNLMSSSAPGEIMSTMTAADYGTVTTTRLGDGLVVRLAGSLDVDSLADLRGALLSERPDGCDDVMVDAGAVTEVHERALAVLVAAGDWATQTGGRMQFAAMSVSLLETAAFFDVADLLPRLPGPGGRAGAVENTA